MVATSGEVSRQPQLETLCLRAPGQKLSAFVLAYLPQATEALNIRYHNLATNFVPNLMCMTNVCIICIHVYMYIYIYISVCVCKNQRVSAPSTLYNPCAMQNSLLHSVGDWALRLTLCPEPEGLSPAPWSTEGLRPKISATALGSSCTVGRLCCPKISSKV